MIFNKENTHDSWFPKFRTFVVSDGSGGEKLGFDGMVRCIADYFHKIIYSWSLLQVCSFNYVQVAWSSRNQTSASQVNLLQSSVCPINLYRVLILSRVVNKYGIPKYFLCPKICMLFPELFWTFWCEVLALGLSTMKKPFCYKSN